MFAVLPVARTYPVYTFMYEFIPTQEIRQFRNYPDVYRQLSKHISKHFATRLLTFDLPIR